MWMGFDFFFSFFLFSFFNLVQDDATRGGGGGGGGLVSFLKCSLPSILPKGVEKETLISHESIIWVYFCGL